MLLDRYFPPDIRVEKEARSLVKAGHEVFLLSMGRGDLAAEEEVEGIRVIRVSMPQELTRRVPNYVCVRMIHVHPFWKRALDDVVRKHKVEVIHIHDLPLVKTGLSVAGTCGIPLVADLHENYPEAIRSYQARGLSRLTKPMSVMRLKRLERHCVRKSDKVVTVVEQAKNHYINDCGIPADKVCVVMNCEDSGYFCSLPLDCDIVDKYERDFVISYIGGFGIHRGLHTAISSMRHILKEIPQARLLLVGKGAYEVALRQLATSEGVENRVEFVGWQPFSLVPSYVVASDVCLVPHIASGHTNTTIPHKLFQYMAMSKPLVVSSARPLECIVRETGAGLVFPSGDPEALAREVIRLYRDDSLCAEMGRAGKRATEDIYNWEMEGEKLVNLYLQLSMQYGRCMN